MHRARNHRAPAPTSKHNTHTNNTTPVSHDATHRTRQDRRITDPLFLKTALQWSVAGHRQRNRCQFLRMRAPSMTGAAHPLRSDQTSPNRRSWRVELSSKKSASSSSLVLPSNIVEGKRHANATWQGEHYASTNINVNRNVPNDSKVCAPSRLTKQQHEERASCCRNQPCPVWASPLQRVNHRSPRDTPS